VPALRQIIAKGTVIATAPDKAGRKQVKAARKVGASRDLVAHVMQTKDGNLHGDLSRDERDGARFTPEGDVTLITASR
jgi:hypothetical protein